MRPQTAGRPSCARPCPPLARRPRRPRLLPGPGPHRALAPGPGDGGRDPVGRRAVPQRGEGGERAGPGRGLALVEPAPAPHLIDAGRCLAGLTVPEGRRLRVVALPRPRAHRSLVWWGRGGDGRSASAPGAATTVVARSQIDGPGAGSVPGPRGRGTRARVGTGAGGEVVPGAA